jgi:hypothetical protein
VCCWWRHFDEGNQRFLEEMVVEKEEEDDVR